VGGHDRAWFVNNRLDNVRNVVVGVLVTIRQRLRIVIIVKLRRRDGGLKVTVQAVVLVIVGGGGRRGFFLE